MEAMRIGCAPGKHTRTLPPEMWPKLDPKELMWRETGGNLSTYDIQQLRNLQPRECTRAPWAEHPELSLVSQYNRNNDFI